MLGIGFAVGLGTSYHMDGEDTTDAAAFFDTLTIGGMVELADEDAAGTAEAIELDD